MPILYQLLLGIAIKSRQDVSVKLFSRHDNLLLTREDDLVYNENNSSERNFLENYCYLLTVTKEVEE